GEAPSADGGRSHPGGREAVLRRAASKAHAGGVRIDGRRPFALRLAAQAECHFALLAATAGLLDNQGNDRRKGGRLECSMRTSNRSEKPKDYPRKSWPSGCMWCGRRSPSGKRGCPSPMPTC